MMTNGGMLYTTTCGMSEGRVAVRQDPDPGNRAQRVNRGVIVFHTVKVMLANSLEVVPSESGEFHVV